MGHKEWESDDFLAEFLDFDYKKPVPDDREKRSSGLPADKASVTESEQRRYGLEGDTGTPVKRGLPEDKSAGMKSVPTEYEDLRSSNAFHADIPEPLSARRAASSGTKTPAAPATVTADDHAGKSKSRKGFRHVNATELASEALGAAKKLVTTDEDLPPEEIPSAADAARVSDLEEMNYGKKKSSRRKSNKQEQNFAGNTAGFITDKGQSVNSGSTGETDELAALFEELGETGNNPGLSSEENEALAQAQQDAYDRYRSNYTKKVNKKNAEGKVGWFPKWTSRIYVLALAAFGVALTLMNVLPGGALIAVYVILALLSIIIIMQLRKKKVKIWARVLATITAIILIGCYGVGTAYTLGTLSFLDFTSVENDNRVASITKEPFNVCITGIDVDGKITKEGRSDVNMIITVNPSTEQILMTSIPRDYEIYMPDKDNAMDKLTHTGFYSVDTTIGAEEQLLDTKINYFVKVNFTTVKKFIDAIGGVDVYSEYEFTPVKMKSWTVQEGWNHMNGKQALAFARERKAFIDGDNQRIKNQQAVMEAVLKKAMSSKTMLLSYNKILSSLREYFQMSFSSAELRSLFKFQLARNPEWKIYKNTIIGGDGSMPTYSTGSAYAYVMTQDQESIDNAKALINAVLQGQELTKDSDDKTIVAGGENGENTEDNANGDTEG